MKRKNASEDSRSPTKKARPEVPEYHMTPTIKEEDGSVRWPAPVQQIERARDIIRACAAAQRRTLIVPDKDADGLSSGAILRHTLVLMGLPSELIDVHLLSKGTTVHSEGEREVMSARNPSFVFVLDHGSRSGPPIVEAAGVTLVIDHHHATPADFPERSEHVTACDSPPVATSSLLTYLICEPLHPGVRDRCAWLCIVGTHGDLGNTLKWQPPFPDMRDKLKQHTKKVLNDVVSLANAPRRTARYDVRSAWDALCETAEPASVLGNARLLQARREVNDEVERCTHTAPRFSADGRVACFRITSEAQVHPVIATRWAGHLQSRALEIVMVANDGYLPGKVNFSCRIPRCARAREPPVDIIQSLKAYANLTDTKGAPQGEDKGDLDEVPLLERLGSDFARGHVQASGGIVNADEFEELMELMQIGVKPEKSATGGKESRKQQQKKKIIDASQNNTLLGYFGKQSNAEISAK
ncbi:DHH phosphoesterase [Polychaeton citri CBS 116435]|uniref:DHH phosphoesterase n=1 Tax=Polychaeton citri CBS 116435 TaxID=1314669 RepID=A0A9P4Q2F2_9PEZI|nr:DHH phosphoesterase [Polychaeton citri CBS 116435]